MEFPTSLLMNFAMHYIVMKYPPSRKSTHNGQIKYFDASGAEMLFHHIADTRIGELYQ